MSLYLKGWQWIFVTILSLSLIGGFLVLLEKTKEEPLSDLADMAVPEIQRLQDPGEGWDR